MKKPRINDVLVQQVPCPKCGATTLMSCRGRYGRTVLAFHEERREAARAVKAQTYKGVT